MEVKDDTPLLSRFPKIEKTPVEKDGLAKISKKTTEKKPTKKASSSIIKGDKNGLGLT